MEYKLRYLPTITQDMIDADEYMSETSPDMARRFFVMLDEKLLKLQSTPFMYQVYPEYPIYRRIVIMDYLVFYCVDEEKCTVDVHRIINSKMLIVKQLVET